MSAKALLNATGFAVLFWLATICVVLWGLS